MDVSLDMLCHLVKNNEHPNILLEHITYAWVNILFQSVNQLRSKDEVQGTEANIIKQYLLILSPAIDVDKLNVQNLKRKTLRLISSGKGNERCVFPMQGLLPELGPYCKLAGVSPETLLKISKGEKPTVSVKYQDITCGLMLELNLFFNKQNLTNSRKLYVLSSLLSAPVEFIHCNETKLVYALKKLHNKWKSLKNSSRLLDFLNSPFKVPSCFELNFKAVDASSSIVNDNQSLKISECNAEFIECNEISEIPFAEIVNNAEIINSLGELSEKCLIEENLCCDVSKNKIVDAFPSSIPSVIENTLHDISVEENLFENEKFYDAELFSTINTISNNTSSISNYKTNENLNDIESYINLEDMSSIDISRSVSKLNYDDKCMNLEIAEVLPDQKFLGRYCYLAGLTHDLLLKAINDEKLFMQIHDKYLTKGLILELDSYFVKHKFPYKQRLKVLSNLLSVHVELNYKNVDQLVICLKRLHRARSKFKKSSILYLRFLTSPFQLPSCLSNYNREIANLSGVIFPSVDFSLEDEILRRSLLRAREESCRSKKILRATIQQKLLTEKILRRKINMLELQLKRLRKDTRVRTISSTSNMFSRIVSQSKEKKSEIFNAEICDRLNIKHQENITRQPAQSDSESKLEDTIKFYESKLQDMKNKCLLINKQKVLKQQRLYYYKKRYGITKRLLNYWINGRR